MSLPSRSSYDVVIAGGGPAGSSAAIRLARAGLSVLLVERTKFPRQKLCGEFVSPECLAHFEELEVLPAMISAGAVSVDRTVFYSKRGSRVAIDNDWSSKGGSAIGISRSEMDSKLLNGARDAGAEVLEDTSVTDPIREDGSVTGLELRTSTHENLHVMGKCVIDATGRRSLLRSEGGKADRAKLVAFKTHLQGASIEKGSCEIYSYAGGYGGCNEVEDGLFNVCFIVRAADVRAVGSDIDRVMRETLGSNSRADKVLRGASRQEQWLSVPIERFGRGSCLPAPGLLAIGDAASFIDPFTGSGILLGLQSSSIAARAIIEYFPGGRYDLIAKEYLRLYAQAFGRRLRVSSVLRHAAFMPNAAEAVIRLLRLSPAIGQRLARSTRSSGEHSV